MPSAKPRPRLENVDDQSWMLSFVCTRIGEQHDLLLPTWATTSFTTFAGQAGWRGIKPSLDALLDVAATGSSIKPTSPPAAWPLHKSNGISRRGKEGDITQP